MLWHGICPGAGSDGVWQRPAKTFLAGTQGSFFGRRFAGCEHGGFEISSDSAAAHPRALRGFTRARGGQPFSADGLQLPRDPEAARGRVFLAFRRTGSRTGLPGACSCHLTGNQQIPRVRRTLRRSPPEKDLTEALRLKNIWDESTFPRFRPQCGCFGVCFGTSLNS